MDFTTRPAQPTDLPLILQILKEGAEALSAKGIDQWQSWHNPTPELLAWVQEGLAAGEFHFLDAGKDTIGMYRLLKEDELYWGKQDIPAHYVHSLAVRPAWAGHGIGTRLLERLFVQAKAEGAQVFRLDCVADNPRLRQYYEALGFNAVGETHLRDRTFTLLERPL